MSVNALAPFGVARGCLGGPAAPVFPGETPGGYIKCCGTILIKFVSALTLRPIAAPHATAAAAAAAVSIACDAIPNGVRHISLLFFLPSQAFPTAFFTHILSSFLDLGSLVAVKVGFGGKTNYIKSAR